MNFTMIDNRQHFSSDPFLGILQNCKSRNNPRGKGKPYQHQSEGFDEFNNNEIF